MRDLSTGVEQQIREHILPRILSPEFATAMQNMAAAFQNLHDAVDAKRREAGMTWDELIEYGAAWRTREDAALEVDFRRSAERMAQGE